MLSFGTKQWCRITFLSAPSKAILYLRKYLNIAGYISKCLNILLFKLWFLCPLYFHIFYPISFATEWLKIIKIDNGKINIYGWWKTTNITQCKVLLTFIGKSSFCCSIVSWMIGYINARNTQPWICVWSSVRPTLNFP